MPDDPSPPLDSVLSPQLYAHLRRVANGLVGSMAFATLQPTALVHEAFLKLAGVAPELADDPSHFVSLNVRAMRQVIMDSARRKNAQKRGSNPLRVTLTGLSQSASVELVDLIALDRCLGELASLDPAQATVVELRFFGGYSMPEIAELTSCSLTTVERRWRQARAWLRVRLAQADE